MWRRVVALSSAAIIGLLAFLGVSVVGRGNVSTVDSLLVDRLADDVDSGTLEDAVVNAILREDVSMYDPESFSRALAAMSRSEAETFYAGLSKRRDSLARERMVLVSLWIPFDPEYQAASIENRPGLVERFILAHADVIPDSLVRIRSAEDELRTFLALHGVDVDQDTIDGLPPVVEITG
jgi:hypothetical protein